MVGRSSVHDYSHVKCNGVARGVFFFFNVVADDGSISFVRQHHIVTIHTRFLFGINPNSSAQWKGLEYRPILFFNRRYPSTFSWLTCNTLSQERALATNDFRAWSVEISQTTCSVQCKTRTYALRSQRSFRLLA